MDSLGMRTMMFGRNRRVHSLVELGALLYRQAIQRHVSARDCQCVLLKHIACCTTLSSCDDHHRALTTHVGLVGSRVHRVPRANRLGIADGDWC